MSYIILTVSHVNKVSNFLKITKKTIKVILENVILNKN